VYLSGIEVRKTVSTQGGYATRELIVAHADLNAIDLAVTPLAYVLLILFIETHMFTKQVQKLLTDESYRMLQSALVFNHDAVIIAPCSVNVCGMFQNGTNHFFIQLSAFKDVFQMPGNRRPLHAK
jgi:hypothetical protein